MAINKNHEFEELNGIKCAIVEKNATRERIDFLKPLLEFNDYEVVVAATPPPKAAPAPVAKPPVEGEAVVPLPPPLPPSPPVAETFTIGVTDVTFNPVNAIFGRVLRTEGNRVVTFGYWHQKEDVPQDQVPYFDNN
jgi:hypothetical protein